MHKGLKKLEAKEKYFHKGNLGNYLKEPGVTRRLLKDCPYNLFWTLWTYIVSGKSSYG